jgi:putative zinc finger/helix-turn-helix YgiT family protein
MNSHSNIYPFPQDITKECDQCGEQSLKKTIEEEVFTYGIKDNAVTLSVKVPGWRCSSCGHAFTDGEAEEVRHEAVCHHFGLLTPGDIAAMRSRYGLTQVGFAKLTGFGEASIKRWEAGLVIQNASADRFIRLISDPFVFARLSALSIEPFDTAPKRQIHHRFRTALPEERHREAAHFQLRKRA